MNENHKSDKSLLTSYIIGFVLSIALTITAFLIVDEGRLRGWSLTLVLLSFATVQLVVQLLFFLHIDRESRPRWNLRVFGFMAMVLLIVVLGSLWIMHNLNYHMNPQEYEEEIIKDEGISN